MKKALLVVDVQSYFLSDAPKDLVNKIAKHIETSEYDLVVFTVFKGAKDSNYERSLHWSSCLEEADLVIPDELIKFVNKDNKFIKTSYSSFYGGEVDKYLKAGGTEAVDICGIDLEACVMATAFGAFDLGYDVKVLFDLAYSRFNLEDSLKALINRNIQSKNRDEK